MREGPRELERATRLQHGGVVADTMTGPFGGSQVQLYAEDFDLAAILGIDAAMAQGIDDTTINRLRSSSVRVHARLGATDVLRERGLESLAFAIVGPMVALECDARGGLHFDGAAWDVDDSSEALAVSSTSNPRHRQPVATGIAASVTREACGCGSDDPRIELRR